jgi:hypothetical protein
MSMSSLRFCVLGIILGSVTAATGRAQTSAPNKAGDAMIEKYLAAETDKLSEVV